MDKTLLADLIRFNGIETAFTDAWGNPTEVAEQDQLKLLAALGFDISDDAKAQNQLDERQKQHWLEPIDPVSVQSQSEQYQLQVRLPIDEVHAELTVTITTEQGQSQQFVFSAIDAELTGAAVLEGALDHSDSGTEVQQYDWTFSADLPLGYHQLQLAIAGDDEIYQQSFIVTPERCFQPDEFSLKKQWGVSVQLYGVKSDSNWGIGDFNDLGRLVKHLAKQGADFVGLNPIHALYPAMPESASPYSPSSRRWLNLIYLSVPLLPGYGQCQQTAHLVQAPGFADQLAAQRAKDWVDYSGVMQLKLPVLKTLFHWFTEHQQQVPELVTAFDSFKQQGGDSLRQLALYDALHMYLIAKNPDAWGWPNWPEQYRSADSEAVREFAAANQDDIEFFSYLQFCAQQQLATVQQQAKDCGMLLGLYRDLAVGVSEASTEIWANPDLYCRNASVGAPPDILGPKGQNWGLPPMLPYQLFRQAYRPMIELFRANMQDSGALRIDHVMALLRLWWVPKGAKSAGEGAYVYYPIMDLLGILALESQRQQAVVIGEDLGTVPDGIFELLQQFGMYSYRIFFFEQAEDGGFISPAHYPVQAMAALTTHDMPTLIGFWHCSDLKLGLDIGLYTEQLLPGLYQDRHNSKQRILDSLHGHQALPADFGRQIDQMGMSRQLSFAMQQHLAKGSCQLLCLQLEDWMEMTQPVNVPGTSDEYPNWRRKLSMTLEQLEQQPHINQHLQNLTANRRSGLYS
ncbi:MAG: 4-alpha-glucanotransferase [Gammaproteobacteria bacterium]|nr:4-alpha-glucanotransferase [Gammaproteobacteria bacterium]